MCQLYKWRTDCLRWRQLQARSYQCQDPNNAEEVYILYINTFQGGIFIGRMAGTLKQIFDKPVRDPNGRKTGRSRRGQARLMQTFFAAGLPARGTPEKLAADFWSIKMEKNNRVVRRMVHGGPFCWQLSEFLTKNGKCTHGTARTPKLLLYVQIL